MSADTSSQQLPVIKDIFTPEQHKSWDENIMKKMKKMKRVVANAQEIRDNPNTAQMLLEAIISHDRRLYEDDLSDSYFRWEKCDNSEELRNELAAAYAEGQFSRIRCLAVLRKDEPVKSRDHDDSNPAVVPEEDSYNATITSWSLPFAGNSANLLYQHMVNHSAKKPYARIVPVVQSSGMGKSRMVDELGKKHIVIPLNLRGDAGYGFPATDLNVLYWFRMAYQLGPDRSDIRCTAFLSALFEEVINIMGSEDPKVAIRAAIEQDETLSLDQRNKAFEELCGDTTIANHFRVYMTVGQRMKQQGALRCKFYGRVLERAAEIDSHLKDQPRSHEASMRLFPSSKDPTSQVSLDTIAKQLLTLIDPSFPAIATSSLGTGAPMIADSSTPLKLLVSDIASTDTSINKSNTHNSTPSDSRTLPLVVLAFDEAHTITEVATDHGVRWSGYTSLRRALSSVQKYPIWTVFLSTAGKISQFSPAPHADLSTRVVQQLFQSIPPFCELGFDLLVQQKVTGDGVLTLDDVITPEFRVSLGRPLWASRFNAGSKQIKDGMVEFAVEKLLCKRYDPLTKMAEGIPECLAVFSIRLALQINPSASMGEVKEDLKEIEARQVERFMRVCLAVDPGFDSMLTVAPSEPMLAEAAALVAQHHNFSSATELASLLEKPGMSKGDRGELIVANLTICTIDRLTFQQSPNDPIKRDRYVVGVVEFMKALFAPKGFYGSNLEFASSSRVRKGTPKRTFGDTFKDAKLYVTHFIKVHDFKVLHQKFLLGYIARGAAVICANNQRGVDLVIPFIYKDASLKTTNVSAILMQSKNDASYSNKPKMHLFDAMNPFRLGIFDKKNKSPLPIIRIVYALAARSPEIRVIDAESTRTRTYLPRAAKDKTQVTKDKAQGAKDSSRIKADLSYTAFDIWCSKATSDVFQAIDKNENSAYARLLEASQKLPSNISETARSMFPGATAQVGHWNMFADLIYGDDGGDELGDEESDESCAEEESGAEE